GLIFRPGLPDWAIPVLFMRLREGRLFDINSTTNESQAEPSSAQDKLMPRFIVPFLPNKRFVGRQLDLDHLHSALQQAELPVMLTGLGGIGKTQLAVEYAYKHKGDYPGGVYWVQAGKEWDTVVLAGLAKLAD